MTHEKKAVLDALLEKYKAQPVGWGYIDIIVVRENVRPLVEALVKNGYEINGISWWEYIENEDSPNIYGMGGPKSRFYSGWFGEVGCDLKEVPIIKDQAEKISFIIEFVENYILHDDISYKNTPSLTPALWLDVDDSWRNIQLETHPDE